jgi:hypothetical protein
LGLRPACTGDYYYGGGGGGDGDEAFQDVSPANFFSQFGSRTQHPATL